METKETKSHTFRLDWAVIIKIKQLSFVMSYRERRRVTASDIIERAIKVYNAKLNADGEGVDPING